MGAIDYTIEKIANKKLLRNAKRITAMALLSGLLLTGSACQRGEKDTCKTDEFGNTYTVYNPENLSEKEICHGENLSEYHVLNGNKVDIYGKDYQAECEECGKELKKPFEDHEVNETHPVVVKGFVGYWLLPERKGTCENCGKEVYSDIIVEESNMTR